MRQILEQAGKIHLKDFYSHINVAQIRNVSTIGHATSGQDHLQRKHYQDRRIFLRIINVAFHFKYCQCQLM